MARESTPLRGVAASSSSSSSSSKRNTRLALVIGAVVIAIVGVASWATNGHEHLRVVAPTTSTLPTTSSPPSTKTIVDVTVSMDSTSDSVSCGVAHTETGYISLPNKKADNYFYWYYESRDSPSTDSLVVWLTGGPGCSSLMALLAENGPCTVQGDLTTEINPYSWNSHANVIWLDQPSNVGYSYSTEPSDTDTNEANVGENFLWFLIGFLDKHPELEGRDLYITGESYAGHYVPAVAHTLWKATQAIHDAERQVRVKLKGIAIGNGLTNPKIQMDHMLDMANNTYDIELMNPEELADAQEKFPKCLETMKELLEDGHFESDDPRVIECSFVMAPFQRAHRNPYDIRLPCDASDLTQCYDFSSVSNYLNSDAVREYLNVTSNPRKEWVECDVLVGYEFMQSGDVIANYAGYVAELLDESDVRVLLYAGDADTVCNWYGNKAWASALEWKHKKEFNEAPDHPFTTSKGKLKAGIAKAYSNKFTFVRVFNAGHLVPHDQPAVALEMIEKFFNGEEF